MPSAAILNGGLATRFGGWDKSAVLVGGRPILARQLAELTRVSDDLMLVGAAGGVGTAALSVTAYPVRLVPDRTRGCGPLGGLDAALAAARAAPLVLLACDMPFVTARLLEHLLSLAADADAVVPHTERGYHPLCAVYTPACQPAVARCLTDRRLRMIDLLDELRVRVVTEAELDALGDPARLLANVNTPADRDGVEALWNHEP